MQDFSQEETIKNIERLHRVTTANKNPSATSVPPFLAAEIANCDMSEKIKSTIIKANQEANSAVFVLQIYSKSLQERKNVALKYRVDISKGKTRQSKVM